MIKNLIARLRAGFAAWWRQTWRCDCGTDWLTGEDRPCPVHPPAPLERDTVRWARTLAVLDAKADVWRLRGGDFEAAADELSRCVAEIRQGVRL